MGSLWDFFEGWNDHCSRRAILGAGGGLGKDRLDRQPLPAQIPKPPGSLIFPWLGRN
jgi:hypothetical protein